MTSSRIDWALDANLILRQATRRVLCGCIEYTNGQVWVPQRAMDMVDLRYPKIARVRARRIGDRERESAPTHESEVQYEERLAQRAAGMQEAFTHWLVQETRRNDRGWLLAAATPETVRITQRLFLAGVAQEGTTSEVEEDAQVGAQALHAGCRWIAADNSGMLRGEEFRDWLRAEHAAGRLLSAADPFRLTPDQAIGKMLGPRYETETAGVLTAIAWELIRPGNEAPRTGHHSPDRAPAPLGEKLPGRRGTEDRKDLGTIGTLAEGKPREGARPHSRTRLHREARAHAPLGAPPGTGRARRDHPDPSTTPGDATRRGAYQHRTRQVLRR